MPARRRSNNGGGETYLERLLAEFSGCCRPEEAQRPSYRAASPAAAAAPRPGWPAPDAAADALVARLRDRLRPHRHLALALVAHRDAPRAQRGAQRARVDAQWAAPLGDWAAGSRVELELRVLPVTTTVAGQPKGFQLDVRGNVTVGVRYLTSYEGMGAAELRCADGCSCAPRTLTAHQPKRRESVDRVEEVAVALDGLERGRRTSVTGRGAGTQQTTAGQRPERRSRGVRD